MILINIIIIIIFVVIGNKVFGKDNQSSLNPRSGLLMCLIFGISAHPNVRVFITHGGLLSTQESFYHSTPVLAIPIFGDQPKNGMNIQNNGLGLMLVWEELTVELIVNSLQEIISSPK